MPTIPDLVLGPAASHRAVTVVPLFTNAACQLPSYRIGCEALAEGVLEVSEVDDDGAVDRLVARNRAGERMLLLEGDHLVGARQNRVLTSSAIVGAKGRVVLPVSCVEQGRWQGQSSRFAATSTMAPAAVRRILKQSVTASLIARRQRVADQAGVWRAIDAQQRSLRVTSATRALSHSYAERARDVGEVAGRLPYPERATGVAIGVGEELVSIDVFDRPETCRFYWSRLVEGAALEALGDGARMRGRVGSTDVQAIVDGLRAAPWTAVAPVGEGEELRARTSEAAASLLLLDGAIVHFGVAVGTPVQVQSNARVMRRGQPEVLADRYRIIARVGVGGAKEVFRALDTKENREVAVARVPWVDAEEFANEVALAQRVRSKYTPEIYDSFVDENEDGYLVMEFCEGKTLAQLADGPVPLADAGPILVDFARGLAAIHEARILHRDVKLENVLLCPRPDGVALKILDFGLSASARSTATDVGHALPASGTFPYMSREAMMGRRLDARSDVYSFGISCFRLLVGELPVLPHEHESDFEYLIRLRQVERHDLSRLPALPEPVVGILARMLDGQRDHRPYMPEVVAVFEREFGTGSIPASVRVKRREIALECVVSVELALASPDHLIVAQCATAPLIAISPGSDGTTTARAFDGQGRALWTRRIDGVLTAGTRADLDGDGVRELYLAGTERVVALTAGGEVRFSAPLGDGEHRGDREQPRATGTPTLIAIADATTPRLVVDGRIIEPRTGRELGPLNYAYEGNGSELVRARGMRGVSYNGFAMQAFHGDHEAAAAIIQHPGADNFLVAHLEEPTAHSDSSAVNAARRVMLSIYGPGGHRQRCLFIASTALPTGNLAEIQRVLESQTPLFGPEQAPLAVLGPDGMAAVIVPLLTADPSIEPVLVAYEAAEGRRLWRCNLQRRGGRALLADLHGNGKPSLLVGDGHELVARDPWTGTSTDPLTCAGLPIAYGDPFGAGVAHLVTVSAGAIELWRGPACTPNAMQWSGLRGDVWRTGTFGFGAR
ncbi:MAG TPA: serine/threonine-protein kinase [Kofleriaceae bacterium]